MGNWLIRKWIGNQLFNNGFDIQIGNWISNQSVFKLEIEELVINWVMYWIVY